MGIQGLLPLLRSIHERRKLSEFSGTTLAVDGYVWLHRGVYGCAAQIINGAPTTRYVDFAMSRIRLLLHNKITPYVVFDGCLLPAKKETEFRRRQSRQENRSIAMKLVQQGKHNEAFEYFAKAVDVTPELAYQFIKMLRVHGVPYVVAPYEADAQLAFLENNGMVDGIITEDSDLLVFGCKLVLFKLDSDGNCTCIRRDRFSSVRDLSLHGWTDRQFREMAILSGCDYLPSVPGLGLKTAHRLLRKYKTVEKVLDAIRAQSRFRIPPNYLKDFRAAELAFTHQRVFDPTLKRLVCLTSDGAPPYQGSGPFIGEDIEPSVAALVANGDVNPFTMRRMIDILPQFRPEANASQRGFVLNPDLGRQNVLPITDYFKTQSSSKRQSASNGNSVSAKENLEVREPRESRMHDVRTASLASSEGSRKRKIDVGDGDTSDGFITTPVFSRYFRQARTLDSPLGEPVASPEALHTGIAHDILTKADLRPCVHISSPPERSSHSSDFDDVPSPERTLSNGHLKGSRWSSQGTHLSSAMRLSTKSQDPASVSDVHVETGQVKGCSGSEELSHSANYDSLNPISDDPFIATNLTVQKLKLTPHNQPISFDRIQRRGLPKEESCREILPINYNHNLPLSGRTNYPLRIPDNTDAVHSAYKPLRLR